MHWTNIPEVGIILQSVQPSFIQAKLFELFKGRLIRMKLFQWLARPIQSHQFTILISPCQPPMLILVVMEQSSPLLLWYKNQFVSYKGTCTNRITTIPEDIKISRASPANMPQIVDYASCPSKNLPVSSLPAQLK